MMSHGHSRSVILTAALCSGWNYSHFIYEIGWRGFSSLDKATLKKEIELGFKSIYGLVQSLYGITMADAHLQVYGDA